MPNVWLRPPNQRKEADAAKAALSVPDGDHLTLLNVYNHYQQSSSFIYPYTSPSVDLKLFCADIYDKSWACNNYIASRSMAQADNVRAQLQRIMERFEIDVVSTQDERKLYTNTRKVLVCGHFMQIAHKEAEKNGYLTMKDNQVCLTATKQSVGMLMHAS